MNQNLWNKCISSGGLVYHVILTSGSTLLRYWGVWTMEWNCVLLRYVGSQEDDVCVTCSCVSAEFLMTIYCEVVDASEILLSKQVTRSDRESLTVWLTKAKTTFIWLMNDPQCLSDKVLSCKKIEREVRSKNIMLDVLQTARQCRTFWCCSRASYPHRNNGR